VDKDIVSDKIEGSEESDDSSKVEIKGEKYETLYDRGVDTDKGKHQHTSLPPLSMCDDDASIYRDNHYQESDKVCRDGYLDYLHQPLPPAEPRRPMIALHRFSSDQLTDLEETQSFLNAVPEMKMNFGVNYSNDSNYLFGSPTNGSIGNDRLHR
jgi:hypothetical protein